MKPKNQFLYFVLLLIKEITSAPTDTSLLQYDMTKAFNRWFSRVLDFDTNSTLKDVNSALEKVQKYYVALDYDLEHEVEPFPRKFFFIYVDFHQRMIKSYYAPQPTSFSLIDWNLRKNEVSVFSEFVFTAIRGFLGFTKYCDNKFNANLNFKNFKLSTISSSNGNRSMAISYDCFFADGFKVDTNWWNNDTLQFIARNILIRELEPAFVALLEKTINRNSIYFDSAFKAIFSISQQTKQDLLSTNPDVFQKGRKYYYFIPSIPFFCGFALKTVVIKGLSNIESLKFYRDPSPFSHSFFMDNVHGSMVLDYDRVEEEPLQLDFKIDRFCMSIVHANNCVIVEAPEFSVNSTTGPLTRRQSAVLVQLIESAIVTSLMPSRKVCGVPNDAKIPVAVKLRITETSNDWNKIKQICQDWIPFNNGTK